MYLKEFSANWLFQFQFLQICFRIRPKLSCLRMIHKLIPLLFLGLQEANICPVTSFHRSSKSKLTAVAAPCFGVRIQGRNSMSVNGSNHISIRMILVETIPGSAALTVIPSAFSLSESSRVKKPQSQLCIAVNRDTPKTSSLSTNKKFRSNLPYGIRTRNHVHNPGSLPHQR